MSISILKNYPFVFTQILDILFILFPVNFHNNCKKMMATLQQNNTEIYSQFVGAMFARIIRTHALHCQRLHQIHCVAIVTQQTGQCHLTDLGQLL